MATSYDKIYGAFLRKVSDYSFLKMSNDDLNDQFNGWLHSAIPKFGKQCYQDLSNRDEVLNQFNVDLNDIEVEILGVLMTIEWLTPALNDTKVLSQVLTDGDFKIYSQAQHLDKLITLHDKWRKEVNYLISKYTWDNGDLGGLAT
jgi:hypothetical protein